VSDHGTGIAREDQPLIFEQFWQSEAPVCARSRHRHRTGTVKKVMQAHGGESRWRAGPAREMSN
jgi:signal transduction histidine kinase